MAVCVLLFWVLLCLLDVQLLHLLHPPQAAEQQRGADAPCRRARPLLSIKNCWLREQSCCLFLHCWLDDAQKEQRFCLIVIILLFIAVKITLAV